MEINIEIVPEMTSNERDCVNIKQELDKRGTSSHYAFKEETKSKVTSIAWEWHIIKKELDSSLEICRVCLKEGDLPIFDTNNSEGISDDLAVFGGIEVKEDDAYPKYLCSYCHSLLQGAILFRKTAQESDLILRKPPDVKNNNTVNEDEDCDDSNENEESVQNRMSKKHDRNYCKKCDKEFPTLRDYYEHSKTEDHKLRRQESPLVNVEPYVHIPASKNYRNYCKKCDKEFQTLKEYYEHTKTEEHEPRKRKCPVCKVPVSVLLYTLHVDSHKYRIPLNLKNPPYICDICGKVSKQSCQLVRHRVTHFNELPFKCDQCPYRGRFWENLNQHTRIHTGEKPFQCAECAARFSNRSNLNKHMRTHKETRDYNCEMCGRGFYTKRELEEHLRIDHTGIKEHICNFCGKAFGHRNRMMHHQLNVHKREKKRRGKVPLYLQIEQSNLNAVSET